MGKHSHPQGLRSGRSHAGGAGSAAATRALSIAPPPEERPRRSGSRCIAFGIAFGLAILCRPDNAAADMVFCAPATPLPLFERAVPQLADSAMSALGTEEEMRLLANVIDAARRSAKDRGIPLVKRLDVLDERLAQWESRSEATPSPVLSPDERSLLVRWHALCGSEPSAFDHPDTPGHAAAGMSGADSPGSRGDGKPGGNGEGIGRWGSPAAPPAEARISTRQATILALGLLMLAWVGVKFLNVEDKRGARRYSCRVESGIRFGGTQLATVIVDISQTGCKVRTGQLAEGTPCRIWAGGAWRQGRIIWSNAHYTGIQFTRALEVGVVEDIVRSGSAVAFGGSRHGEGGPARAGGARAPHAPRQAPKV